MTTLLKSDPNDYWSCGIDRLDWILGGYGFQLGHTYEIAGPSGSGKTILLHQLCVQALRSEWEGGLEARTTYFDINRTFSLLRLQEIADPPLTMPRPATRDPSTYTPYRSSRPRLFL
ncbi:MAG TPA: hypothetical protein VMV49_13775 [Candidatus Deferrimicrobium sp.]|nr:hypothetical protein [Candidatus Deferrimicrobium sp.]